MRRAAVLLIIALAALTACDSGPVVDERLYGRWTHVDKDGDRLWGTVRFTKNGRFEMRGLKAYNGQMSVDYSGSFEFESRGKLQMLLTSSRDGGFDGQLGFSISDNTDPPRLSLSLPGSAAGGRTALFSKM